MMLNNVYAVLCTSLCIGCLCVVYVLVLHFNAIYVLSFLLA